MSSPKRPRWSGPALLLAVAGGWALASCVAPAPPAAPGLPAATAAPLAVETRAQYRVRATTLELLEVEATFDGPESVALTVDESATRFVEAPEQEGGGQWTALAGDGGTWTARCEQRRCLLRYRFRLRQAGLALHDPEVAIATPGAVVAPHSAWLLHPVEGASGRFRLQVQTGPGLRFVTGLRPAAPAGVAGRELTFEAGLDEVTDGTYAAFGQLSTHPLEVGGARLQVALVGPLPLDPATVLRWVETSARGIAGFFGRYPVDRLLVVVMTNDSNATRAATLGEGGASILLRVGQGATPAIVQEDWVVTHEMLHVGFPYVPRQHAWLSEGVASYVEPLIRARAGLITPEKVWGDLLRDLPEGLPGPDDQGLDSARSRERIYSGGEVFCLLADLTLRERTGNRRSLDDAVRALQAAGGSVSTFWTLERLLEVADGATGTRVLHDLHRQLGTAPGKVDLEALWARLGIRRQPGGAISFDDSAPLAGIRRSMTAPKRATP